MISILTCLAAVLSAPHYDPAIPTLCVPAETATALYDGAAGWYNGDTNTIAIRADLTYGYTQAVLSHEQGHAYDLARGTASNGHPSFFSLTHTGFDIESYARAYSYAAQRWPINEPYPDTLPSLSDIRQMRQAGWLPPLPAVYY